MTTLTLETRTGSTTSIAKNALSELQGSLRGTIIEPSDHGYDEARRVWNGMTDKHLGLIVQCDGPSDVMNAVSFARTNNLLVAVKGGGHSIAGHSVCDGGMMIDLGHMRSVRVDRTRGTARAGAGARWRDFDRETQAFGLATTGGTNSDTGIAGLTLGGGLGWLAGKYGLTCDNLLSADVVMADGRMLTASADENPDLFWALRGGSGNFGIVTSFEYRLHPVTTVLGGLIVYPFDKARDFLRFYAEYSRSIPDELNTLLAMMTLPDGMKAVGVAVCYNGDINAGEEVLRPLREFGPPAAVQVAAMPYFNMQTSMDDLFPPGRQYYWKAHLITRITDRVIDTMLDHFSRVPSPYTAIGFQQLGNAANRVDPDATAFSHRDALYDFVMLSGWEDAGQADANIQWTRALYDTMLPELHTGLYVNGLGTDSGTQTRAAFRPGTYQRLLELKERYDPTNFFSLNPNIHR